MGCHDGDEIGPIHRGVWHTSCLDLDSEHLNGDEDCAVLGSEVEHAAASLGSTTARGGLLIARGTRALVARSPRDVGTRRRARHPYR